MFTESKKPKVSVIINTCDRSQLIGRALESVLQQDFTDFELLVIDASSDESTRAVMDRYQDPRIRYYRIIDEEYFAKTFNYAISLARGGYIAFNDDDDEWISPQKLSKQVALMESLPEDYGVVYCWWEMWFDDVGQPVELPHKSNRGYLFDQMLYDNAIHGTPSLLIKKKLFDELGGLEDDPSVLPSDHFLLTKFSQKYRFDLVPEILVRCHERHDYGSMGRKPSSKFTYRHRANLQILFLKTFAKDYKRLSRARRKRYEMIIDNAVKLSDIQLATKFLCRHLIESADIRYFLWHLAKFIGIAFGFGRTGQKSIC